VATITGAGIVVPVVGMIPGVNRELLVLATGAGSSFKESAGTKKPQRCGFFVGKKSVVTRMLWRGSLLPLGCAAVVKASAPSESDRPRLQDLGLLRSPAGASSLAT